MTNYDRWKLATPKYWEEPEEKEPGEKESGENEPGEEPEHDEEF
jgi:hypothetical protein